MKLDEQNEIVEVDREEELFMRNALEICQKFLNEPEVFFKLAKCFQVEHFELCQHIAKVNVHFADWSCWKQFSASQMALSWISKFEPHRIMINSTCWSRFRRTNDRLEKERILFFVSTLVLHELANMCIQISKK